VVLKDLWGDETQPLAIKTKITKPSTAVSSISKRVAGPGFSYNPSPDAHQDVLAEALALEIKKREKDLRESKSARQTKGVSVKSSALARAVGHVGQVGDDEDEDEADDDDEGDDEVEAEGSSSETRKVKMKEKKTRAQRNKERRRKDVDIERSQEAVERRLLKAIDQIPTLLKSVEKEEERAASLRELRKVQAKSAVDETAMSYYDAGTVPLSDELSGSLRRVIPKGSALSSAVSKFKSTGAFQFRDKSKRKKGDTLHTTRRRVWVAKHKYT
jgi:nucleolar protein 53